VLRNVIRPYNTDDIYVFNLEYTVQYRCTLTFWWRRWARREDGLSDDVIRSRVDVRFSDADVSRVEQSLTNHIVATFEAVCFAVGTELAEWQGLRRRRHVHHSLSDDVVVAVVVVERAPVVGRRLPRVTRDWLTDDVIAETLKTQLQIGMLTGQVS